MKKIDKFMLMLYFYVAWFGCIWADRTLGSLFSLLFPIPALLHVTLKQNIPRSFLGKCVLLIMAGLTFDAFANYLGLIYFEPLVQAPLLPIWLIALWLLYLAYLPLMHDLFQTKYFLSFILGAIFGPLSYLSGEKFGLLFFATKNTLYVYSLFWGFYFVFSMFFLGIKKPQA